MSDEKKIDHDGWCAWNPVEGWLGKDYLFYVRESFEGALEELKDSLMHEFDFVPWAESKGWQILPCKLIEAKRWGKILQWIEGARGYILAMKNLQGTPGFIECQKPHLLDLKVEEELLRLLNELFPEGGTK